MADTLSYAQIEGYWIAAGGDPAQASTMAAIAMAESSGRPGIEQAGQPYATTGWGLWQITPGNSEPSIGTDAALFDPLSNARAAVAKYKAQGLGAWTTYTNGAYRRYLTTVPPATPGTGGGPTPSQAAQAAGQAGQQIISPGLFGGALGGLNIFPTQIIDFFAQAYDTLTGAVRFFTAFFQVSTYIRIAAGLFGTAFFIAGIVFLGREAKAA